MEARDVFIANLNDVLGKKTSVSALVEQFRSQGESIDYSYVMNVRKGKANPSLEKSQQIVSMLKLLPNYSWVEYWMFFVPDYFKRFTRDALAERELTAQGFENFLTELLSTANRFQILKLEKKQYEQLVELGRYIRQKNNGDSAVDADTADKKFLA